MDMDILYGKAKCTMSSSRYSCSIWVFYLIPDGTHVKTPKRAELTVQKEYYHSTNPKHVLVDLYGVMVRAIVDGRLTCDGA